jgi:hypothetical protein
MALPIKTTMDDVREIVPYLRNKPTGATVAEAKAALRPQVLDHRKIGAYVAWGLVTKDDDRLKLTPRGWELARKPELERQVTREVIDSIVPYRSAVEWMHYQGFDTVTIVDVAAQWHEHHSSVLATDNENTIRENVAAFFNLAEAAGFGQIVRGGGRAKTPTRFKVNRDELRQHVEAGPSAPPWREGGDRNELLGDEAEVDGAAPAEEIEPPTGERPEESSVPERVRVFIAHGRNMDIVEQVHTMLGIADIDFEVAEEEETTAIPVPDKVLDAMRRCQAGVIVVSVEEGRRSEDGDYTINENVLIEIGTAFVLYERRVVLVWDKRLPVPSNLQGLYRCEFEGDELTWSAGMKLLKAIQQFKR